MLPAVKPLTAKRSTAASSPYKPNIIKALRTSIHVQPTPPEADSLTFQTR
jgi:hypothetical protein